METEELLQLLQGQKEEAAQLVDWELRRTLTASALVPSRGWQGSIVSTPLPSCNMSNASWKANPVACGQLGVGARGPPKFPTKKRGAQNANLVVSLNWVVSLGLLVGLLHQSSLRLDAQ